MNSILAQNDIEEKLLKYSKEYETLNGKVVNQEMVDTFIKEGLLIFTVSSLKYLETVGRIGKAKALLGKLLKIKPLLSTDEEGYTVSIDTAKTMENCLHFHGESCESRSNSGIRC